MVFVLLFTVLWYNLQVENNLAIVAICKSSLSIPKFGPIVKGRNNYAILFSLV